MEKNSHLPFNAIKSKNGEKIFVNVPWTSRNEWEEVYHKLHANDINSWRGAYNQMLVWKFRTERLPVGIESTLPILHAQIALEDPNLDPSYRSSVLTYAILRFVSVTLKGYGNQQHSRRTLHMLANDINLPIYLVNLRNEIIHGDSILGDCKTLRLAVEDSINWIKKYYWQVEYQDCNTAKPFNLKSRNTLDPLFRKNIDDLTAEAINKSLISSDVGKKAAILLQNKFLEDPDQYMEYTVKNLFYSTNFRQICSSSIKNDDSKCCCKSQWIAPAWLIEGISQIIIFYYIDQHLNHFLQTLVVNSKGNDMLCVMWLRIIFNSLHPDDEESCPEHKIDLCYQGGIENLCVDWKNVIFDLFNLREEWSSSLGHDLSKSASAALIPQQRELLEEFMQICNTEAEIKQTDDSDEQMDLEESLILTEMASAETPINNTRDRVSKRQSRSLGVLPHHQSGYKNLLLKDFVYKKSEILIKE